MSCAASMPPDPLPALAADLRTWVESLVACGDRSTRDPSAYARAAAGLKRMLASWGYTVHREEFSAGGCTCANLHATAAGFDPTRPHWLVGAHHDNAHGTPGADDNLSAVAILLGMARQVAGRPEAAQVRWVAFANEEPPFFHTPEMGSAVCSAACRRRGDDLRGMICLESLGVFASQPGSQAAPADLRQAVVFGQFDDRGDFVALVADERSKGLMESVRGAFAGPPAPPVVGAVMPDLGVSDHWLFWQDRYPALLVTDTAMFRNRHYHQRTDTPEKLDYTTMAAIVDALADWVLRTPPGLNLPPPAGW